MVSFSEVGTLKEKMHKESLCIFMEMLEILGQDFHLLKN